MTPPPDQLEQRLAALSPEKRELVRRRLQSAAAAGPAGTAIPRVSRSESLRLSSAQERLWFLSQLEGPSATYNVAAAFRLSGAIDHTALESALQHVIRRHEVLRTTFVRSVTGEPEQRIAGEDTAATFRLTVERIHGADLAEVEATMRRQAEAAARRPFDLASDRLLRLTLLEHESAEPLLVFVAHHIITDGWSMSVLVRELAESYGAVIAGQPAALPDLAIQYADYSVWEAKALQGPAAASALAWWRETLSGTPPTLALPTDRPRPSALTYRGGTIRFEIDADTMRRLRAVASHEGASVFAASLAVTGMLFGRYSGQDDVVIGCPLANRPLAETQPLIGFFVNTLPIRLALGRAESFRGLVRSTHSAIAGAVAHQALPFDRLVDALQPERDMTRTPVFQVVLAYQPADHAVLTLAGVRATPVPMDTGTAKFALTFILDDTAEGCRGALEYNADLYDAETAQRMVAHFIELLRSSVAQPDSPIATLTMLPAQERRQIVDDWSGLVTAYPRHATVPMLFAEVASAHPDAVALVFGDEEVTYGQLDARATQVAGVLQARGVVAGTMVGLCAERSVELIVGMLGTLKAGGIYVPIDPAYPDARITFLLQDTGATIVLTHGVAQMVMPNGCVAVSIAEAAGSGMRATPVATDAESGAYVMYTSGSTGEPKGVLVPHRAIARLVRNTDFISITADDRFLLLAPSAFDASTLEIWAPLLNGARLAIAPAHAPSLADIGGLLQRHRVTTLWLTSGLFNLMVEERVEDLSGVHQLIVGGDVLSVPHVARAARALVNGHVINGYGPTENTTFTCCHTVDQDRSYPAGIPLGRPIANTRVYILDAAGQPSPAGIPGELYAGGDGLALGYVNRAELTAERFVPNPFGDGRLYRTGDAARWLADGTVEFLGRFDDQVKIRGYRVEPREVEAVLLQRPDISQAAVIVHKAAAGAELIAYVVPAADLPDEGFADRVHEALRASLPDFMVPAVLVPLASLPLTLNGKIDRLALPAAERRPAVEAWVEPRSVTETALAAIYREVLSVPRVGATDSFFSLGGHSLSATKLVSRIRTGLGVDLPLRQVFETPEIARLALAVDAARGEATAAMRAVPRADRSRPLPLSFAQKRLWFLNRLEPDNPFYNIALALRLDGALDILALQSALADIVERHEILRSTYHDADGGPVQRIHAAADMPVVLHRMRSDEDEGDASIDRLARDEARLPFNLETGPIIRATLVEIDEVQHALLITMHHIAADGWSMGVLVQELTTAYEARSVGRQAALPALAVQYADFAAWQQDWAAGEGYARETDYWRRQLAGYPAELGLPSDRPRPSVQSFAGGSIRFAISTRTSERLSALGRECDATLFMTLLAAFAALLSRHAGQHDLMIGSPVAGRTRSELEALVGFFVNTLALRLDTSGDPTFRALIARARETALGGFAHQELPFDRLVDDLQPMRDLSRNPLFQVMFALQNAPLDAIALPGITVTPLDHERTTAQFDIVLDMWERPEGLLGVLEFSTALFDHSTMARLAAQFSTLLDGIAANPDATLSQLPLLGEADRRTLLDRFNDNHAVFPIDQTLPQLFEAQVAAGGDRIAAVDGATTISYRQLNARANRLAHRLRRLGIGRNDFVALLLERGIDLLTAMLGVLKAGAAYVPIDPTYPSDRIEYMVTNSAARVMVARTAFLTGPVAVAASGVTCLIPDDNTWADESDQNPDAVNAPDDRAYMLYTSGSTGLPKGAILRHDGKVNHIYAQFRALQFHRDSVFLQTAPSSSDISVWQFLGPLLIGGRTVVVDHETMCDPAELWQLIRQARPTIIELVPVALTALLEHVATRLPGEREDMALEWAMVTGEAASPALVNRWLEIFPHIPIVNAYGPTEAADDVCQHVVTRPLPADARGVPIGTPLANLWLYVLDERLNLVPIGVAGEICVSGIGVGEGYWQDEVRTRDRFVDNPYSDGRRGRVIYRTGDLGFWRPDGTLECLSRTDHQIKIRGFRIEPGEIEAVLSTHPAVRDALVMAREDGQGDKRLVAYMTPHLSSPDVAGELQRIRDEQVTLWTDLHESEYQQTLDYGDPTFNVIGWDSTYTNAPLPQAEMQEYVAHTVARVLSVRPQRVLEIGCGSGLIMFALVPHVEAYYGLDLSAVAIDRLTTLQQSPALQARVPHLARAVLRSGRADDLSWLAPGSIDTVIFPSVLQYFPGLDYLREVLDAVMRVISPGGAIVFGDVRSLPLLDVFHASVTLFKAHDGDSASEILRRVRERSLQEQEMAIDPAFFQSLTTRYSTPIAVRVLPKRGTGQNEMTRFRYDVIIRVGGQAVEGDELQWHDWRADRISIGALGDRLRTARPAHIALANIANARIGAEGRLLELLNRSQQTAAELRESLSRATREGIEPEDLYALGEQHGYAVHLSMARSAADGRFDALLVRRDVADTFTPRLPAPVVDAGMRLANDPLHERLARFLSPRFREYVRARLPHYMVPADLVILDRMPTTPAGKVDRQALPAPPRSWAAESVSQPPSTHTEKAVAAIWCQVLDLEHCGLGQNFFDCGGHSLKATQVISRVRQQLGVELPLRAVFAHPTIEELAAAIDEATPAGRQSIARIAEADHYPVSLAQRRLWILSQLEDGSVAYNMPAALAIQGALDVDRLEAAFAQTVARHESLRTTFVVVKDEPRQLVHAHLAIPLQRRDLSMAADPEGAAREAALQDAETPFDLAAGPLVRLSLIRVGSARHVLLFNIHHIVSDDWSMGVLIREVMHAYDGVTAPALRLQYRDFSSWHLARLNEAGHRAYWLDRLSGELPVLDLPADHPRPPVKTYRGRSLEGHLPAADLVRLKAVARDSGSTLFMTLIAAAKTLLYRYTGATDLIVAVPVAGREHPDLEDQIGFYINTLALRDRIEPDAPFRALLAEVTRNTTAAIEHQSYPFDRLVDELPLRRDPARMPICDVTVVMATTGAPEFSLSGLSVRPLIETYESSKYDLHFVFDERGNGGLQVSLVYNPDLFEADRMVRMLGHLQTLLRSIADDPSCTVAQLDILPPAERRQLLLEFNPAAQPPVVTRTLSGWFEATAARYPDRIAVSVPLAGTSAALSYADLDRRANGVALALAGRGVRRGTFVGLFAERGIDAIVGMLGILKAGAAYVPVDPAYPPDRIRFIFEDAQVPVVVSSGGLRDRAAAAGVGVIDVSGMAPAALVAPPSAGPSTPDDAAYMIYTSGSTGRPKGVVVTHANATRLFTATENWFHFDETDVWTVFHSLAFDFSVWEIWGALLYGGRAVMVPQDVTRSPEAFAALLQRDGVTVLNQTPSAFGALLDQQQRSGWMLSHQLRWVVFGGEALNPQSLEPWFQHYGDAAPTLVNMYGITETTVHVTYRRLSRADVGSRSVIGAPIPDLQVYLLDQRGQPVPIGVPGEICVGGAGVSRGYWNREDLTTLRFVPNPFGAGRLYKSGDLGRYLANGDIEYLGRLDHQVKIRGFRIELGEIESALTSHAEVRQALVVAQHQPAGDRLVAYVATTMTATDLRRHLQDRLPDYMVPAVIIPVGSFPLTAHGKIDHAALPVPESVALEPADVAADRTSTQRVVADVIGRELGVAHCHLRDNFFDLGAHSLMLIRVHAALQERLDRRFQLAELYRYPSIALLASFLDHDSVPAASAVTDDADARAERRRQGRRPGKDRRGG